MDEKLFGISFRKKMYHQKKERTLCALSPSLNCLNGYVSTLIFENICRIVIDLSIGFQL